MDSCFDMTYMHTHTHTQMNSLSNLGSELGSDSPSKCDFVDCFEVGDIILETSIHNDQEKKEVSMYRLLRVVEMSGKGLYLSNVQAVLAKKFKLDLDPRPLTRAEPFFIINQKSGVTRTYSWMSKV